MYMHVSRSRRRSGFLLLPLFRFLEKKFAMCPWREPESHLRCVESSRDEGCPAGRALAVPPLHLLRSRSGAFLLFTLKAASQLQSGGCDSLFHGVWVLGKCFYVKRYQKFLESVSLCACVSHLQPLIRSVLHVLFSSYEVLYPQSHLNERKLFSWVLKLFKDAAAKVWTCQT